MQIPDEAYALARSAGWEPKETSKCWEADALDPLFFQALGKALDWEGRHSQFSWSKGETINGKMIDFSDIWKQYAKTFYDLILTGGDTKAYWDNLLDKEAVL